MASIVYADTVTRSTDAREASAPGKLFAAAADRNKDAILAELVRVLSAEFLASCGPGRGARVLEVAAGTGQHAVHFVRELGETLSAWQPTDPDESALLSIGAYRAELPERLQAVLLAPRSLDASASSWPRELSSASFDAVLAVNLLHISPPETTGGFLAGSAAALRRGGLALVYGPFLVDGRPTTESNAAFDAKLRGMDPRFGLRDVSAVAEQAASHGLRKVERVAMPSNNFLLVFVRDDAAVGETER